MCHLSFNKFNKFAVFILYCLLSIAVIALAQEEDVLSKCAPKPMVPRTKQVIVGYVQFFTEQQSTIEPKNIPWDFYDYINVIGKNNKDYSFLIFTN
jgi:hypothetical protein